MAPAPEIEIKLNMAGRWREALLNHPALQGPTEVKILHAVYYDTHDWHLRRAHASLRIRITDGAIEQTFKIPAGETSALGRGEFNCSRASATLDLDAFPVPDRQRITQLLAGQTLQPYADVKVQRTKREIRYCDAVIEVAMDMGTVSAGAIETPIAEAELELRQGSLADLLELALELPIGPELMWSVTAKADRAWAIATRNEPEATRATEPAIDRDMTVMQAFQGIAWNCLLQLLHNYPLIVDGVHETALHQSRVALRRLRAAFSFFGHFLGDQSSQALRAELKAATNALGPVRDLDVLIATVVHRLGLKPEGTVSDPLLIQLEAQRADSYRMVHDLLTSASFQRLLFGTALWIERGTWHIHPEVNRPAIDFVRRELQRRRRTILKAGKALDTLASEDRHELRIAIKKLRYASEFCAGLFHDRKVSGLRKAFSGRLGSLQDLLGELNDIAVRRDHELSGLTLVNDIERARLATILAGDQKEEELLMNDACSAWDSAMELRPFWK